MKRLQGFCRRITALFPVVAFVLSATTCSAGPPTVGGSEIERARPLLRDAGLTAVGRRWLCGDEVRLLRELDSLDRVQKQLRQAEKFIDERIAENERQAGRLVEVRQAIAARKEIRAVPGDAAVRKRRAQELAGLAAQEAALTASYLPAEKFAENSEVRAAVIEWINARNTLAVTVLGYPRTIANVEARYAALKSDAGVERALQALGGEAQLGSGRKYSSYERRLDDSRRLALTSDVPLYREAGKWRTSVLLGEARPAACTFVDGSGPMLLPESVARAAGIAVRADAPTLDYAVGDGRRLGVRSIRLRQLRLGSHLVRDVEAYVLPPEGEDLGTQITRQTLGYLRVELQPQKLRLIVESK